MIKMEIYASHSPQNYVFPAHYSPPRARAQKSSGAERSSHLGGLTSLTQEEDFYSKSHTIIYTSSSLIPDELTGEVVLHVDHHCK